MLHNDKYIEYLQDLFSHALCHANMYSKRKKFGFAMFLYEDFHICTGWEMEAFSISYAN